MHYQSIDRCFNMELGYWKENFQQWCMFRDNGITTNEEADVFFQFDPIRTVNINAWMAPAFEEKTVEIRGNKRILINSEGLLAEVPLSGSSTIPHYLKSSIETPEDWKRVKEARFRPDHPARKMDIAKLLARHPENRDYPLGIPSATAMSACCCPISSKAASTASSPSKSTAAPSPAICWISIIGSCASWAALTKCSPAQAGKPFSPI